MKKRGNWVKFQAKPFCFDNITINVVTILNTKYILFSLPALEFEDAELKICCTHAFSHIPMNEHTCETRSRRVLLVKNNQTCADAFLKCCLAAEKLRKKKMREDVQIGLGRSKMAPCFELKEFPNII